MSKYVWLILLLLFFFNALSRSIDQYELEWFDDEENMIKIRGGNICILHIQTITKYQTNRFILERERAQRNSFRSLTFKLACFYHRHLFNMRLIFIEWILAILTKHQKKICVWVDWFFFAMSIECFICRRMFRVFIALKCIDPFKNLFEWQKNRVFSIMICVCVVCSICSKSFSFTYLFARQKLLKIEYCSGGWEESKAKRKIIPKYTNQLMFSENISLDENYKILWRMRSYTLKSRPQEVASTAEKIEKIVKIRKIFLKYKKIGKN